MPPQNAEHSEIKHLLEQNAELLKQNHELLRKMHRNSMIGIGIRIVWFAFLIGLPFALYFFLLEPYFEAFGSNYDTFRAGIAELPGLKGLELILPKPGS